MRILDPHGVDSEPVPDILSSTGAAADEYVVEIECVRLYRAGLEVLRPEPIPNRGGLPLVERNQLFSDGLCALGV